ncbi:S9 family peptidase [Sphingomonas canadensis]|uniref:S9 family peptidase n=1 Tax=Sphingomonas canadensis TaxID=1219257 RepID=A0ABW3H3W8_9SPHN|nr:S9 family peptidase [Sphingomonas canadensis]MCW3835886.1 S9 family peptidase [Sphingomonas canadensis]
MKLGGMAFAAAAGLLLSTGTGAQELPKPPVAEKRPHVVKAPFGAERTDEYYWLRDDTRKDPAVLAYLTAENAYADAVLAPTKPVAAKLFAETVSRIKQDDSTVPWLMRGYWYYTRFEAGADYPILARRKGSMDAPEEILLDQQAMAAGKSFFQVAGWAVSQDNRYLAWADDDVGRRQYVVRVKDLATGRMLADTIPNVDEAPVWSNDGKTLFYIDKDPVTLLSKRIKAHAIGTASADDRLVHDEKDDSYYLSITRTSDDKFLCIYLSATVSTEQRCASADDPREFVPIAARERDFEYQADHAGGRWVVRTNWKAPNFRLMTAADADGFKGRAAWKDLVPASADVFIEDFQPFDGFLAIEERSGGNKRLRILPAKGEARHVAADEPAYSMTLDTNPDPASAWLRYRYDSLLSPTATWEVNAATGERRLLKVKAAPGYDPAKYVTERVWVTARDGAKVPVSLIYAKGFRKDGTAALLQEAYGSYGNSYDPEFTPKIASLLDRGMVYALAHIRGGQEMGRAWYEDGRLLKKQNSFNDFIDVTRALVKQGYAAPGRVAATGGSAGGLLMGGIANMAPGDYRVIRARVPFVDAVTTMLDASIPLTTNEYDEWGNPENKAYYDYILGYSPYDNIAARDYPALFVTTGLWDSQVQYYEPAKWVARLRAKKTDANPLVFRIDMTSGHGGKSGRLERHRQEAEWMAFMLQQLGVKE